MDQINIITETTRDRLKRRRGSTTQRKKKKEKITDETFRILRYGEQNELNRCYYRVTQLRQMCKFYGLRQTGNKNELTIRLQNYLENSGSAVIIQKIWRGYVVRMFIKSKGVSGISVSECANETDFLTMDSIRDIPLTQLFMFRAKNGVLYGFDTVSLYNLILRDGNNATNPYTREPIPKTIARNLIRSVRYGKLAGFNIDVKFDPDEALQPMSPVQRLQMRTIDLFQRIDALGNYTDTQWFMSLNAQGLRTMIRELWDIWSYRANIATSTKCDICPPRGDPFANVEIGMMRGMSFETLWRTTLSVLERMVNTGVDNNSKSLGALYVLSALTLVSPEAAHSLPWLYDSVVYTA